MHFTCTWLSLVFIQVWCMVHVCLSEFDCPWLNASPGGGGGSSVGWYPCYYHYCCYYNHWLVTFARNCGAVLCPSVSCFEYFWYVTNQPPKANSAFHPSGVGKWVPASARRAKAGMIHSVSGWTWGVQVKLRDPLRMCAIPECVRGVFTTRCYTNPRSPLPYFWEFVLCVMVVVMAVMWRQGPVA